MNVRLSIVYNFCFWTFATCAINSTWRRAAAEDNYLSYDYENESANLELKSDPFLLPNPENIDSKYTVDVLPNVELPDDSLSDTDLRDHDFIDNLMYVYYGSHNRSGRTYGPEVVIVGSVLSCAAQLLTICWVLLTNNFNGKKETRALFLQLLGAFCFSNLLFMLGVYAIRNTFKCLVIALVLHYSHLLNAFWVFIYCYYIYKRFSSSNIASYKYFISAAYVIPLFVTTISFLAAPNSFETKRFCFISVQKGMIINYMLPVSILIVTTTVYSLNGIRKINIELTKLEFSSSAESLNALKNEIEGVEKKQSGDEEVTGLKESKTCLKLLCVLQTGYDIVWFVAVLALENNTDTNSMAVIYSVTSCLLYWYMFVKAKCFLPRLMHNARSDDHFLPQIQAKVNMNNEELEISRGSSDSVPLLVNVENSTEMKELRLDFISTISN